MNERTNTHEKRTNTSDRRTLKRSRVCLREEEKTNRGVPERCREKEKKGKSFMCVVVGGF